jgi:hypothetical protein
MQDKAGTSPDQQQEHSTEKDESGDQAPEAVDSAVPASKGERSGLGINPFGAYHVVSSAASYLHSRAMGIMPFGPGNDAKDDPTIMAFVSGESSDGLSLDEASFVATTNSVTSMVAAKEEERQAVADDLNSSRSCPCEWFVCDDDQNSTRYFVVQVLLICAQILMVIQYIVSDLRASQSNFVPLWLFAFVTCRAQNQLLLGRPTFYLNLSNLRFDDTTS